MSIEEQEMSISDRKWHIEKLQRESLKKKEDLEALQQIKEWEYEKIEKQKQVLTHSPERQQIS